MRRSDVSRLSAVIVVLGLLIWWPVVTGLPVAAAESPAAVSADDGGVFRVQVAAGFSSRRAKKTKRKIEKDDKFKDHKILIQYSAKSGVYRVEVGDTQSRRFRITVEPQPRVTRIDLSGTYPAYIGGRPWEEKAASGHVRKPTGTRVKVTFKANRAIQRAFLRFDWGEEQKVDG